MNQFSHIDQEGRARMVDISSKDISEREAVARGSISMQPETFRMIREGQVKKGDVLAVAQVAGIMAAKKTSELIPMCHPIQISLAEMRFSPVDEENRIDIEDFCFEIK